MDSDALPLPVAILRRRSHNAKSAKDLHDTAYFAWEVSVRLAVSANPPAEASALARSSLGAWVDALDPNDRMLAAPALLDAYQLFTEIGSDRAARPERVAAQTLLRALPAYRNRIVGHGSVRRAAFYAEAGPILLRGVEAAWKEGLFWDDDRLTFVESVEIGADGEQRGRVLDLMGDHALVLEPRGSRIPDGVRPGRVYVRGADRWRSLYPLVLYADEEGLERVYLFDAVRARGARFLDYAAGQPLGGKALEQRFPGTADALRERIGSWKPDEVPVREDVERIGPYELLGEIGRGGMGVVYLARQPDLGRMAAVKVLSEGLGSDDVAQARFRREVTALGRSEHPNVIRILDSGTDAGRPYYAMEYVEGADLAEVAAQLPHTRDFDAAVAQAWREKRQARTALHQDPTLADLSEELIPVTGDHYGRIALLCRDAARGLQHLHEQGIVHRDIKPANILVTAHHHRAVIMDLGLASLSDASRALTETLGVVGTLRYIAPEQLDPKIGAVDPRADVYALGVVLFELVTGSPLFEGDTPGRLIDQVLRAAPRRPESVDPRVPDDLATIVSKATERDPRRRYADAATLAADLDAFLERRPIAARPATLRYVMRLAIRRNRPIALLAASLVLLLVGGTIGFMFHLKAVKDNEAGLRAEAEASRDRAKGLAQAMLLELSQYPDSPEVAARVDSFAPAVYSYFGALPVADLSDDELEGHHQAFDWMASHLEEAKHYEGALVHRRRARVLLEEQLRRDPEHRERQAWLAEIWLSEGDTLSECNRSEDARAAWDRGLRLAGALDATGLGKDVVTALVNLFDGVADTLAEEGAHESSLAHRRAGRRFLEALSNRHPTRWAQKESLLSCLESEGDTLIALTRLEPALTAWEQAQAIRRARMVETPEDLTLVKDYYDRECMIADALAQASRGKQALPRYRAALEGATKLHRDHPEAREVRTCLAGVHDSLGSLLEDLGRNEESDVHYEKAAALRAEDG